MLGLSSLLRPKVVLAVALLALAGGAAWHYRSVIADRAELITQNRELRLQLGDVQSALEAERAAVLAVQRQRAEAEEALRAFLAGREGDPDSQAWAATLVPEGELGRLCAALPWLEGCGQ